MTTHDVLVIGAGHNGLAAGAYLARAGLDTLVLEAGARIGGMTNTCAPIEAAPNHRMSLCAVDVIFMRGNSVRRDLELDRFGYRELEVDPSYIYFNSDDASLAFWRDPRKTADEIRRFSPPDAAAFLELARDLDAMIDVAGAYLESDAIRPGVRTVARTAGAAVRRARQLPAVSALAVASAAEALYGRFRSEIVRNAIAQLTTTAAGPLDADMSGLGLTFLGFLHRWGIGRPIGGTQAVPDSMMASMVASGGRVRTGARVEALLTSGNRVIGVRLVGGEEITARHGVLSTIDPAQLLGELLPDAVLNDRQRARVAGISAAAFGARPAKVDVALSGRLRLERYEKWRGDGLDLRTPSGLIGGLDAVLRSFPQAAGGQIPDDIHLFTVVPTAMDPSQAPDGQDTLYLYAPAMPRNPVIPWPEQAEAMGKAMVSAAAQHYDGIEELEIGRVVETPEDMARRTGASYAAPPFHVDFAFSRFGPLRPALGMAGARGPVPGLFLGGAGSHPGPGISGAPGRLAAQAVIRSSRR